MREIDRNKLKLKYILGIDTGASIDEYDFMYEVVRAYEKRGWQLDGESKTLSQLKWGGLFITIEGKTMEQSLEKLGELGWLDINYEKGIVYYKIIDHPW